MILCCVCKRLLDHNRCSAPPELDYDEVVASLATGQKGKEPDIAEQDRIKDLEDQLASLKAVVVAIQERQRGDSIENEAGPSRMDRPRGESKLLCLNTIDQ